MKTIRIGKISKTKPLVPTLRFSPTAWAKLLYLRDRGDTEVGGFGISASDDPLLLTDFLLIRQTCSSITVRFDDQAVADYFDHQVDRGLQPSQFARVWIHTHPARSPEPSATDERTFARVFGSTDWAVMFILARGGQTYARLRFSAGPGTALAIPVTVDYGQPFSASDLAAWDAEYKASVRQEPEVLLFDPEPPTAQLDEAAPRFSDMVNWLEPWADWPFEPEEIPNQQGPFDDF